MEKRRHCCERKGEREERTLLYKLCFHRNSSYCQFNIVFLLVLIGGYASNGAPGQGPQSEGDSSNTTIFVGGLDPNVTDEDLRQPFSQYGEIASVKIPVGKGCGFVQFANRENAEEALHKLNGTVIGKQSVRLSWGRNPANKQASLSPFTSSTQFKKIEYNA
ncbi:hypothetical protein CISIN_1g029152mg [Citrus sinensis]|uniref:RRM domain-containing protein n=1 Tax=Citrus sinensis TaxID=2711 RepID=A0A067DBA3_CITSI|nr:hypothetical protein CISIN_1g029152mg [Citrus sinensis]